MDPKVSFVVPCYKLAHLLPECVYSLLSQTYKDFEVLIMDDCSPDNTPEVAASFNDARVKHIRNEPNLGHLANYNKGISLSRGKYVWLISADDCLRRPYVLEKYVNLLEAHPGVGFAFCPAVKLRDGKEVGRCDYSVISGQDTIFPGPALLTKLVHENIIVAAAGLVRKQCYDKAGMFPLDMPWGGDWYLWCSFALISDAAYFAEPMVCYREHQLSMTNLLMGQDLKACSSDDISIPWAIKRKAESAGFQEVVKSCLQSIAGEYARHIASKRYKTSTDVSMSLDEFERSLDQNSADAKEKRWLRARVYAKMADRYYWQGELSLASRYYGLAVEKNPLMPKIWAKRTLLGCGNLGGRLRKLRSQIYQRSGNSPVA